MAYRFRDKASAKTIPIIPLEQAALDSWLKNQDPAVAHWVASTGFRAEPGSLSLVAGPNGALERVLAGIDPQGGPWATAGLPGRLPAGSYRIDGRLGKQAATNAALGWAIASYNFDRYRARKAKPFPALVWPAACDRAAVRRGAEATHLVRDLINTPAEDMGPAELAAATRKVARAHGAKIRVITGEALLKANYPTLHRVGRASVNAPRLIDLTWGKARAPKVTLVGKGVCFDSGGLDLKAASGMLRMKKDMGGGANMLGLASMIMAAKLPVRLRLLIGAVENSVAGNAYRPADVITTRKGITVEVGNTDAEGRLVMCDALAEADRENPDLLIDCATLTGAARTAVGTEIAALFCNDDATARDLLSHGTSEHDPLWRLPLHAPYRRLIDSRVADVNNVSEGPAAGAITAALFLNEFVSPATPWVHLDIMGWNAGARPGRPVGGEAMGMRALYALIEKRFNR